MGLALNITQIALISVSLLTFAGLALVGRTPERLVAAALLLVMVVSPYVARQDVWLLALPSAALLAILVALSLLADRWWLLGAAGLQLLAFSSHLAPLLGPPPDLWPAVTVRIFIWVGLLGLCWFGAAESRWATYAEVGRP